jgi:uncharacterized protein YneF (UPF0154 family)
MTEKTVDAILIFLVGVVVGLIIAVIGGFFFPCVNP